MSTKSWRSKSWARTGCRKSRALRRRIDRPPTARKRHLQICEWPQRADAVFSGRRSNNQSRDDFYDVFSLLGQFSWTYVFDLLRGFFCATVARNLGSALTSAYAGRAGCLDTGLPSDRLPGSFGSLGEVPASAIGSPKSRLRKSKWLTC